MSPAPAEDALSGTGDIQVPSWTEFVEEDLREAIQQLDEEAAREAAARPPKPESAEEPRKRGGRRARKVVKRKDDEKFWPGMSVVRTNSTLSSTHKLTLKDDCHLLPGSV